MPINPHTHLIGHGERQGAGLLAYVYQEEGVAVLPPCIGLETGEGVTRVRVNSPYNISLLGHDLWNGMYVWLSVLTT